jgi:hypothetical protein
MTGKRIIFTSFLLLYTVYTARAVSFPWDTIIIRNCTDGDIFIEVEYWEGPENYSEFVRFLKEINGFGISFVVFFNTPITRLGPNRQSLFLEFRPDKINRWKDDNSYNCLRIIPTLTKLRSLFKTFVITNTEGDVLYSLDNAHEEDFVKESLNDVTFKYSLEINDIKSRAGISATELKSVGLLEDGVAPAWKQDNECIIVNELGNIIVSLKDLGVNIHSRGRFAGGYLLVETDYIRTVDRKTGFIDKTGKLVMTPYNHMEYFSDGLAAVQIFINDPYGAVGVISKWGYIREDGDLVIGTVFDKVTSFHEGRAFVRKDGSWFLIDRDGRIVSKEAFKAVNEKGGFSEGLAAVCAVNHRWGYIDRDGNWYIPAQFDAVHDFSEGLAFVCPSGSNAWNIIDMEGNIVFENIVNNASLEYDLRFVDGWALIREGQDNNRKYRYLSKDGKVLPGPYDEAQYFSERIARVKVGDKEGAIDQNGVWVIWPGEYEKLMVFRDGIAIASSGGKYGAVNEDDEWVVPPVYDKLSNFSNGVSIARKDGKVGYINTKGEWLF